MTISRNPKDAIPLADDRGAAAPSGTQASSLHRMVEPLHSDEATLHARLAALGALDAAEPEPSTTPPPCPCVDDDPEGPREQAERARQERLFEELFDAE